VGAACGWWRGHGGHGDGERNVGMELKCKYVCKEKVLIGKNESWIINIESYR
jgi:hypothetical protein